ncbi:MAG: DNA-binding response regulator [Planctomycetota bacterium]|nr:MAG: DNA-binding response regulator [Planctomycetota bacterium]
MTDPTRDAHLFLVDDHSMTRAGMRTLINDMPGLRVVGDHGKAREAIDLIGQLKPDLVLLDITMPALSGIDAISKIRAVHPEVRIVMLSHHEGDSFVEQSLEQGADGYLSKDSEPEELALAIRSTLAGNTYISPKVTRAVLDRCRAGQSASTHDGLSALTPREREVFQLLAVGHSNKEVARDLEMSVGTAKKHRENLQRKLDCHSPAELARLAIREGLLNPD